MGMFNYVKVPDVDCPRCKKVIPANSGWQSKDCEVENMCETVDFYTCENFYTTCPHCEKWIEFVKKDKNFKLEVESFGFKARSVEDLPDYLK